MPAEPVIAAFQDRLADCMIADQRRIAGLLRQARGRLRFGQPADRVLERVGREIAGSVRRREERARSLPHPTYTDALPVVARRDEIARAIGESQVIVVCGETGSGKSTQLPKICLEIGRGAAGMIGHTQPRRIAARSVAARIAEELGTSIGRGVGFKVRFTDETREGTYVKVMTDGVLLAETQGDRLLEQYDTIIVDEAHERSLNIDFLLGYLRHLLPRRPDLKVIVTSATIDPQKFAEHFGIPLPPTPGGGCEASDRGGASGPMAPVPPGAAPPPASQSLGPLPHRWRGRGDVVPIIEVSGRTYPVETRYRPPHADDPDAADRDLTQAILDAIDELATEPQAPSPKEGIGGGQDEHGNAGQADARPDARPPRPRPQPFPGRGGDILVFLPGEREIRETAEALRTHHPHGVEVLPLYARLSAEEQMRVFRPHPLRRVVLATNVAETSITVPGITGVVDPGLARINRYSVRSRVQGLLIEPISQASADQRAGRCGRIAPGVCIRLYSEADFAGRERFTDPEILRTNLAGVVLRMHALHLGRVEDFPFLDPPDPRRVKDAYETLTELGALDTERRLTAVGHELARLPVDPRIGRMILAARDEGVLPEVLVIAAALSVLDPRERPADRAQQADASHAAFADPDSDFLAYLKLWEAYHERAAHLSNNKLRAWCRERFISYLRIREWEDVHRQLRELAAETPPARGGAPADGHGGRGARRPSRGARGDAIDPPDRPPTPAAERRPTQEPAHPRYDAIHRALLAGLLTSIGVRGDGFEYTGCHAARFSIFPGSALFRERPRWIMAAELVRTTRLYGRTVARIRPQWVEQVGAHLVKRTYSDPSWHTGSARVIAYESVALAGLEVVGRRKVHYGPIAPPIAREMFIRHALVRGEIDTTAPFRRHNDAVLREAQGVEARVRRSGVVADEPARFAFYDRLVPPGVYSGEAFEGWRRRAEREHPRILFMSLADAIAPDAPSPAEADYPPALPADGALLPASYHYEPGEADDGVSITVPLEALGRLSPSRAEWLVPGLAREKVAELIRALPKAHRKAFGAAPTFADEFLRAHPFGEGDLLDLLSAEAARVTGTPIPRDAWRPESLPQHLRLRIRVVDETGRQVAAGRDLGEVRREAEEKAGPLRLHAPGLERDGLTRWDFGDLPQTLPITSAGIRLDAFPAIIDRGESVSIRALDSRAAADEQTRLGVRRLFLLAANDDLRRLQHQLPGLDRLAAHYATLGPAAALWDDLRALIADAAFTPDSPVVRRRADFESRLDAGLQRLAAAAFGAIDFCRPILAEFHALSLALAAPAPPASAPAIADVRRQVSGLVYPGCLSRTPREWLRHVPRYLAAARLRLERLGRVGPARDARSMEQVHDVERRLERARVAARPAAAADLARLRWLVEELRVSLFAQELRTIEPVSPARLRDAIERTA